MRFPIHPKERKVPTIPPKGQRIRIIIDSDAKNEIDDQWAIALAILSPERFDIAGFVGANFDNARGGPGGISASVEEIKTVLDKTDCPEVDWDLSYRFKGTLGSILRCYHIDRDATFPLLYNNLTAASG